MPKPKDENRRARSSKRVRANAAEKPSSTKVPSASPEKTTSKAPNAGTKTIIPIHQPTERFPAKPFPVVGIGASAGGLEAVTSFLLALPANTGMAFVLVQHMDPMHESILDKLLARNTLMPVTQVEDGTSVEPNCVYVIPPNAEMTISDGILKLAARPPGMPWHTPIDTFLCSLAEDQNIRAIGIVLSGIGSDGTKGLQAVKAEGGITFAQDEESSKYPGMPSNAVGAGCVDLVLPADKIAAELARMILHPYLQLAPQAIESELPSVGDGNLDKIFLLLRSATGVDFTNYKQTTIRRRIARRMVLCRCETIAQYAKYIPTHPEEVPLLFEDLLIQVTSFFRDSEVFQLLKKQVFPRICAALEPGEPIRIWVPGCSSGEEVYSIAIALSEFLSESDSQRPIQIFGTDVSETAIRKARAALYPESATVPLGPERLRRFLVKSEGGYRISKLIRDSCVFARHDVTKDPPFSRMDLISCRNLLIYLGLPLQKKVLNYLRYALKPKGFLLLGKNESVSAASDLFTQEDRNANIYVKSSLQERRLAEFRTVEYEKTAAERPARAIKPLLPVPDLRKEAERIILRCYTPPGFVVNPALEIVYVQGDTNPFARLLPGAPNLNLLKLVWPELMLEIRLAIQEAKKSRVAIHRKGIQFKHNGNTDLVDLEVAPISASRTSEEIGFLILFKDLRPPSVTERSGKRSPKAEISRAEKLERELALAHHHLRVLAENQEAADEELRASNEELISNNEELQSTNEELQTAKEELQSGNEELTTLNAELQSRNVEMSQTARDLSSLLNAIEIPVVIVDDARRLRHFTPAAARLLNLISSDVGHPISRVRPNLNFPDLDQVAAEMLRSSHPVEKEVQDGTGRWYALRAYGYKTTENEPEGVLIEIVDINDIKQLSTAIVETTTQPLLVLDSQFRVLSANAAFYQKFRVRREDTENRLLFELGNGQWNIPKLRELLEKVLPDKKTIEGFQVEHDFPEIGHKIMLLNARQLYQDTIGTEKVLLVIEDTLKQQSGETVAESQPA